MSDVIIIGAGASGLAVAQQLSRAGRSVVVLEARDYAGGRAHTFRDSEFTTPTELGAEFIHGNLPVTLGLLKEYGLPYSPAKGQVWHARSGELEKSKDFVEEYHHLLEKKLNALREDIPIHEFLQANFPGDEFLALRKEVLGFVEGYESGEAERFSTFEFRKDWLEAEDWEQYRVDGGYQKLMDAMAREATANSCVFHVSTIVREIRWKSGEVKVLCENGKTFSAAKAVLTVPLGIWQAESIAFSPPLPEKTESAKKLGFGNVIKILLVFKSKFWENKRLNEGLGENLDKLFFLFSEAPVPTWWTQYPSSFPLLTGWLSGPKAKKRTDVPDEQILNESLKSLSLIFQEEEVRIREELQTWKIANWSKDVFTRGSYNYATVDAQKHIEILGRPVMDTLFFAGEVFSSGGTVESALASGMETAAQILRG